MSKQKAWTPAEIGKLIELYPNHTKTKVALVLKRSADSVSHQIKSLLAKGKLTGKQAEVPDKDAAFWRREAQTASRQLSEARHKKTAVDVLVDEAKSLAPLTYAPPKPVIRPAKRDKGSPQSAVLMFSDTHVGQVIKPDQTLGFGGYNFSIFLNRLKRLEDSVFSILEDHTTTAVPEIVIPIMGDMLHGNLIHSVEAGQVNTLFEQFYSAGHAFAQFLRNLSALAPIRVYTVVGNHPRWGTQKKMPTDNRYSNLDQFLYAYVEALLRDCPNIKFRLDKQPFALFDVQGFRFYAGHGDNLRGGDKNLGIPNHAIGRTVSTSAQMFSMNSRALPNYYLFGHLHRPITLPHANGEVIINGGFPGIDGFGLMESFTPSLPSQKFFLVHPKHGRSATYDLRLNIYDGEPEKTYHVPEGFKCQ